MKNISIKAIFLGLLTDIGGSFLVGIAIGIALVVAHVSESKDMKTFEATMTTPPVLVASLVLGLGATVLAGFVTAWVAPAAKITNALIFGGFSTLIGLAFIDGYPTWYVVSCIVLMLPSAWLGAHLRILMESKVP